MRLLDGTELTIPSSKDGEPYAYQGTNACGGCGAVIFWFLTPARKRSPHDADGISHFATCPAAANFRRRGDHPLAHT